MPEAGPTRTYDVVVVGGGIVGLAAAYQLQKESPRLSVAVLEKEPALGAHQTGRNSGVVHAGIYYEPGSSKALLCRAGKEELERFAEDSGIPFERCGKLIVAVDATELARLDELHRRGAANGVPGLRMLESGDIPEVEPNVSGLRALLSPTTGIIDFAAVARALGRRIEEHGGGIWVGTRVDGLRHRTGRWRLETSTGPFEARMVVTCAGLHSDRVAELTGATGRGRIVPFRGRYLLLRPHARSLVRGLVYPVPDPRLPFLGIHLTRRIDGEVLVGPNVALAFAREGYRPWIVQPRDVWDMLRFAGLWRLLARYPGAAAKELRREVSRRAFVAEARRFVPALSNDDVVGGPAGVRAQLVNPDGTLEHDFSFEGGRGLLHVRNAPSPAATSSLAIGRVVAAELLRNT